MWTGKVWVVDSAKVYLGWWYRYGIPFVYWWF